MLTSSAETLHDFLMSSERVEARQVYNWLKLSAIATILAAGGVSALLVRSEYAIERKANLLTTMAAGFGTAHLVINFGFLRWPEFGGWVIGGWLVTSCVIWLRTLIALLRVWPDVPASARVQARGAIRLLCIRCVGR